MDKKLGYAQGKRKIFYTCACGVSAAAFRNFLDLRKSRWLFFGTLFPKVYLPLKMLYSALFLRDVYRTYEVVNDFDFLRIMRKLFFFADFDSVHKRIKNFLR